MTKRSELQHRLAEGKARLMTRIANRLFSFRASGLDGFLKRRLLGSHQRSDDTAGDAARDALKQG